MTKLSAQQKQKWNNRTYIQSYIEKEKNDKYVVRYSFWVMK